MNPMLKICSYTRFIHLLESVYDWMGWFVDCSVSVCLPRRNRVISHWKELHTMRYIFPLVCSTCSRFESIVLVEVGLVWERERESSREPSDKDVGRIYVSSPRILFVTHKAGRMSYRVSFSKLTPQIRAWMKAKTEICLNGKYVHVDGCIDVVIETTVLKDNVNYVMKEHRVLKIYERSPLN